MKPTNLRGRSRLQHTLRKNTRRIDVGSSKQLEDLLEQGVSVYQMDIRGSSLPGRQDAKGRLISQTNALPAPELLQHPVLTALQERRRTRSKPGARQDGYKIALAVEGGGLRGSVSAGMASALAHLGAEDAFDMVERTRWHVLSAAGLQRKLNHCMNVLSSSWECTSGRMATTASM